MGISLDGDQNKEPQTPPDHTLREQFSDRIDTVKDLIGNNRSQIMVLFVTASLFHVINCLDNPNMARFSVESIIDSIYYWISSTLTIGYGDKHPDSTLTKFLWMLSMAGTYGVAGKYVKDAVSRRNPEKRFTDNVFQVSTSFIHEGILKIDGKISDSIERILNSNNVETPIIKKAIRRAKKTPQDDPFLRFSPRDRATIHSLVKPVVAKFLNRDMVDITEEGAELEEVTYWVALTWEKYGMERNLIPRFIIVPEWSLEDKVLASAKSSEDDPHQALRILTMKKMSEDIKTGKPQVCFPVKVLKRTINGAVAN